MPSLHSFDFYEIILYYLYYMVSLHCGRGCVSVSQKVSGCCPEPLLSRDAFTSAVLLQQSLYSPCMYWFSCTGGPAYIRKSAILLHAHAKAASVFGYPRYAATTTNLSPLLPHRQGYKFLNCLVEDVCVCWTFA